MPQTYALFIFRRDMRLDDNSAFLDALASGVPIIPCFIFNPDQIDRTRNAYYSSNCVQFMIECLESLDAQLIEKGFDRLRVCYGYDADVLDALMAKKSLKISAVYTNADYTPYARKRDAMLAQWCETHGVALHTRGDYTLHGINDIKTSSGNKPYTVFTPFYRACIARSGAVMAPRACASPTHDIKYSKKLSLEITWKRVHEFYTHNPHIALHGGRVNALAILENIKNGAFNHYDRERDNPALAKTTMASAYLKFGCISMREMYDACTQQKLTGLVRELYWREFYANVAYHYDHVLAGMTGKPHNKAMKLQYDNIPWDNSQAWIDAWCSGNTGFPIVDAGIRQMLQTGYMHNRLRMIVSSFLIKDMHVDWRIGERFFAQHLIDYDPASNSGGWQWSASTGADAQPYFRIFNPWTQHERFDPQGVYIKRYVPQLQSVDPVHLRKWHDPKVRQLYANTVAYVDPVLDHNHERQVTLKVYAT